MRTYGVAPEVRAPEFPLFMYRGLGASPVQAVAPLAATGASSIATAAGAASIAGPIGAAAGVIIGLIGGLMAAHALRAKQAKDENSAVNLGVSGFDSDLRQINQAFNSGQIDAAGAEQAVQVAMQNYWALVTPHIQPNRNGCAGGANCGAVDQYCKSMANGAACCVGCTALSPSITGPNGVMAALAGQSQAKNGPNVSNIQKVYPSKYGTSARGAYTLTWQQLASASVGGSIQSAISGGNPLLLVGLALGAFFLLK